MCRFSPLGRGAIGGVGSNPRTQRQPTPLPLPGGEMLSSLASVIYLILIPYRLWADTHNTAWNIFPKVLKVSFQDHAGEAKTVRYCPPQVAKHP